MVNLQLIKIMNYIFGEDKFEKSKYDVFESSYKLEYLDIANKEFESLNNSLKQLNGFELPQHEYFDIFDNTRCKYESISEKADFGEDCESVSDFIQKDSCTNSDLTPDSTNLSCNDETLNLKYPGLDVISNNSIEENFDKAKRSIMGLELDSIKPNTLDVIDRQIITHIIDEKIESEESTSTQAEQLTNLTKN